MLDDKLKRARLLVVDDEEANVQLLRRILEPNGFTRIRSTNDPTEVDEILQEYDADLILLDLLMPDMDGFEVLDVIRERTADDAYRPVLVLTSDHTHGAKRRALAGGAKDYLTKPLSPAEVRLRVKNLLETRVLHQALANQNQLLEERVKERTSELEDARMEVIHRLARAAEFRDDATGEHTRRVGRMAGRIGEELGLGDGEVEVLRLAAPLHDVGKIGIPDSILLSPERLTPDEFDVMKTHTTIGGELLGGSDVPLLARASEIALSHHEWWEGGGYPHALAGEAIPLAGRIVTVADTFDALTHARPYKHAWSPGEAMEEIQRSAGRQYDPEVVAAFMSVVGTLGAVPG